MFSFCHSSYFHQDISEYSPLLRTCCYSIVIQSVNMKISIINILYCQKQRKLGPSNRSKRRRRDLPFGILYIVSKISKALQYVRTDNKQYKIYFFCISLSLFSSYWALNMNPKNKLPLFPSVVVKKFLQSLCRVKLREKLES